MHLWGNNLATAFSNLKQRVKRTDDELPWMRPWPLSRRCKARSGGRANVRCELRPHSSDIDHAFERGLLVRWPNLVQEGCYEA